MKFVVVRSSDKQPVDPPIPPSQFGVDLVALLEVTEQQALLDALGDATGEFRFERQDHTDGGASIWQILMRVEFERFAKMRASHKQRLENVLRVEAARLFEEFPGHRLEKVQIVPHRKSVGEPEVAPYDSTKGFATSEQFYAARELVVVGEPVYGGFGRIVRARRLHLETEVAIKYFDPTPLNVNTAERRDKARERLIREGGLLASIRHPNVVRLQDQTLVAGEPVLVLEYIQGRTLDALRQERGPLPLMESVDYVTQVLDALAMCHERNVIHRDVAPKNVVVEDGGRAVLIDFGLGVSEEYLDGTRLTSQAMGTPGFRAPELESEPLRVHPTVDIFSVGALLTFMLTGRPPRLGVPPDLPDASPELTQLVGRALEVNPDKRPTSARELCEALKDSLQPVPKGRSLPAATVLNEQDVMEALGIRTPVILGGPLKEFIDDFSASVATLVHHPARDAGLALLLTAGRDNVVGWGTTKKPESRRETKKLEQVMSRTMAVLSGTFQAPPSDKVTQAFNQARAHGWLVQGSYDAWEPGMESGSGWRSIYSITSLGLRWLQQNAQYRSP